VISSSRSSAPGRCSATIPSSAGPWAAFLGFCARDFAGQKLVQLNNQKLCVVVLVVNQLALRLRAGFRRSKLLTEASLSRSWRSIESERRALVLAVYDEKREIGMELEPEWNEELRWIFFEQGGR